MLRRVIDHHLGVYVTAMAVALVHLLDDAYVHPDGPGNGLGTGLMATLIVASGVWAFSESGAVGRVWIAAASGAVAMLGSFSTHVVPALQHGPSGGDVTGIAYAVAGVLLLGLAAALTTRSDEGPVTA